ncbi:MAG: bifunctional nuclease domain-containing protein [Patescibacteria group bacterium]
MPINLIEVEVTQLIEGTAAGNKKVLGLVLAEKDGPRILTIELEASDALMLTTLTEKVKLEDPPLPWVVVNMLRVLGAEVICVTIAKTKEKILRALMKLNGKDSILIRPPDAIAMITDASILVAEELLMNPTDKQLAKRETREEKKAREAVAVENAKKNERLKAEIEQLDKAIDKALTAQDFHKVAELQKELHIKRLLLGDIARPIDPGIIALLDENELSPIL